MRTAVIKAWGRVLSLLGLVSMILMGCGADPCGSADECKKWGQCTLSHGVCVAAQDSDCESSQVCKQHGACVSIDGVCEARKDYDCKLT
ncbi:MAG TPA: hypothetical protein PKW66_28170, partial [Polyangiaceae bacterium]|nr:hypothetical protein [Polyangiaceae bacterium]